jgi:HAD superfamily hydrolase (TIGR01509 family)
MIILIPLGGSGKRFKDCGFSEPKGLIKVLDRPILYYLLDNLKITNDIRYIYIPYHKDYFDYNFEEKLKKRYQNIKFKFLKLINNTRGAAETIKISLENIINNNFIDCPILCLDGDNFYDINYDIIGAWNKKNMIFTFLDKNIEPLWSYVKYESNKIINIVEKEKISDNACCGSYGFESVLELYKYCNLIIENNITIKNEFYTTIVIKQMLNDNKEFMNKKVENKYYFSLGTPTQVESFKKTLLLDLDGTLVDTDFIYLEIWKEILKKYNLIIDDNFYNHFIKGKSDAFFLKYLLSEISDEEIIELSILKDHKFIEYINLNKMNILHENVTEFLEKNKNKKISIVTSCNRKAAEFLINYTNMNEYINLIISADDCKNHKPDPEPYLKAINKLKVKKENCIIFEDSLSGYKSAVNAEIKNISLKINIDTNNTIRDLTEHKFSNYKEIIDFDFIYNKVENNNLLEIKSKLKYLPFTEIISNNVFLKTGYICDIESYSIKYVNNSKENIILKISNFDNELSKVANKLNMYKNEYYFYDKLKDIVNIKTPRYFGTIEVNNRIGIILEDLNKYDGKFNLDLNYNINLLLKVIDKVYDIHSRFYFYKKENVINTMKNLKTINNINYYKNLVDERFDIFMNKNNLLFTQKEKNIILTIKNNYGKIQDLLSSYPLSFCHGDLKSPNIFYMNKNKPFFLDWQYIHLNKGVSDIVFLLIESIDFNEITTNIVEKYYYKKYIDSKINLSYNDYLLDFKLSFCAFPFFVMVWFNSENPDVLLDKIFPIKFMKNLLKYFNYYFDEEFLNFLNK